MYQYIYKNHQNIFLSLLVILSSFSISCQHFKTQKISSNQHNQKSDHHDKLVTQLTNLLSTPSFRDQPIAIETLQLMSISSFDITKEVLDHQSWLTVYQFRNKIKHSFHQISLDPHQFINQLETYCEQRLRHARHELNLNAILNLDDDNYQEFFHKPVYQHQREPMSWSQMYSLIKYGDPESLDYFSSKMTQMILKQAGQDIKTNPGDWILATPAGFQEDEPAAKKASLILGQKIADKLGIESAPVYLTKKQSVYYSDLDNALTRFDLAMTQYEKRKTSKKHLIIVDDAAVSGATFWAVMSAFGPHIQVYSACIVDVRCQNMSVEGVLNHASVQGADSLLPILNDEKAEISSRALLSVLNTDKKTLVKILSALTKNRLKTLYLTAKASHRLRKRDKTGHFQFIENYYFKTTGLKS